MMVTTELPIIPESSDEDILDEDDPLGLYQGTVVAQADDSGDVSLFVVGACIDVGTDSTVHFHSDQTLPLHRLHQKLFVARPAALRQLLWFLRKRRFPDLLQSPAVNLRLRTTS